MSTTEHKGTDVQKHADGYLALAQDAAVVQEILQANLGGEALSSFDLPRVKIPGAGGTTWEVPSLEGDQPVKVLEGIVIHHKRVRAYWPGEFKGSEPPACSSDDSKVGVGDPGGMCDACPLAQFGSDPKAGRGQACKQMEMWFLLRPDALLPLVVTLPPMSLGPARKYRLNLTSAMLQIGRVVTTLSLATDTNPDGQEFAYAVPAMKHPLSPDDAQRAKNYADSIREVLDRAPAVAPATEAHDPGPDFPPVDDDELQRRASEYEQQVKADAEVSF